MKFICYSQISAGYNILETYIELQYFRSILAIGITYRKKTIDQQLQLIQILNRLIIEKIDVKMNKYTDKILLLPQKYNIKSLVYFLNIVLYEYGNQVPCMYIHVCLLIIKSLSISEIGPNPDETRNQKAHKQMG